MHGFYAHIIKFSVSLRQEKNYNASMYSMNVGTQVLQGLQIRLHIH